MIDWHLQSGANCGIIWALVGQPKGTSQAGADPWTGEAIPLPERSPSKWIVTQSNLLRKLEPEGYKTPSGFAFFGGDRMMRTASGREPTLTVAFRVPLSVYTRAQELAAKRGFEALSDILRPATLAGLEAMERGNEQTMEVKGDAIKSKP